MPLLGEQVTPALPRRGRLALPAVLGGLWGWFILRRFEYTPTRLQGGFLGMSGDWLWMALVVSPVVLWLLLFTRVEQRVRLVAAVGVITTFAGAVALRVWFHLREPALGIDSPWWFSWTSLVMPLVIALSGVVLGLVALAFSRLVLRRAVRQTNPARLCWSCGYDLATPPATKCSECGRAFKPVWERPSRSWRLIAAGQRAARPVLMLASVALVALIVHRVATEVIPAQAFLAHYRDHARFVGHLTRLDSSSSGQSVRLDRGLARIVDLPDDDAEFLVLLRTSSPPTIQVWTIEPIPAVRLGRPYWVKPNAPVISLSPAQTAHVLRHGLPEQMLRSMKEAANVAEGDAPSGESFDPAPFFPPEP